MALSSDVTEPKSNKKVTGFGSADILLHYDRVKLMNLKKNGAWPGDLQLAFCVHDGTAAGGWRTVACVQPSDDSPFIAGQVAESTDRPTRGTSDGSRLCRFDSPEPWSSFANL